ncbi:DUF3667 domain-containing protein [Ichthyenterobacterium magnum]|uniref:Uncharacterized protein DUF3667 n=1 Tax=Ichthyenterobacterium magnum TaxID=1230530 RepID=A0A420DLT2_9FLAO|nr:DUF3667 domain-containing protein [Ichthyenterobacterium magnum]RKE95244.1 uncharacterized protein DUF3667 [Ichthyenterobacterium magnum]
MKTEQVDCQNCDKTFEDGFEFCPHCGQKTDEDLTLSVLFYNTISNYFSFDARFLKGFIFLMFKPGFLPQKFIEGKRLLYLHPGQMYLFVAFIFFFIFSFTVTENTNDLNKALQENDRISLSGGEIKTIEKPTLDSIQINKILKPIKNNQEVLGVAENDVKVLDSIIKSESVNDMQTAGLTFDFDEKKVDSLIKVGAEDKAVYTAMGMPDDAGFIKRKFYAQMLKLYKEKGVGSILLTLYNSLPIALFFLLPIFALILKILYRKKGPYTHHLVFSLYYFSFLFTAISLVYLINILIDIPDWIDWVLIASTFFYLMIAVKRFYKQGWFLSWFKSGLTTFLFLLFVTPFTIIIVGIFSFMFY